MATPLLSILYTFLLINYLFYQLLANSHHSISTCLQPTQNKVFPLCVSLGVSFQMWLLGFKSNNFILNRFYYMKSPSRQVVNRDIKTSMNILLRQDNPQKLTPNHSNFRRVIQGTPEIICRQLQVIGWRYKTSLPIIRPVSYQLLQCEAKRSIIVQPAMRASLNESPTKSSGNQMDTKILIDYVRGRPELQELTVEVAIESIYCRLSDLGCLPFTQIIYLLKEMMIGYDVLLDIFGCFQPTDEMIAVSSSWQWRVWLNQDFTLNTKPEKSSSIGEKELIYKLIFIAEKHCTPTSLSKTFFSDIKEFTYSKDCSFIRILEKIKEFVTANKIFQVNKVTITEKKVNDSMEEPKKQFVLFNQNNNSTSIRQEKKVFPFPKPKLQTSGFFQFQSKSSTNLMDMYRHNSSAMLSPTSPLHRNMNVSAIETHKPSPNAFPHPAYPSNGTISSNNEQDSPTYKSRDRRDINQSVNLGNLQFQRRSNFYPNLKPLSPQPVPLIQQHSKPIAVSKSRLELKALVNAKKSQSPKQPPPSPVVVEEKKPQKKPARKYSQQIVKVKSLDALTSKKFAGSNIYMNDPETKVAVNVIKQPQLKPKISLGDSSAQDSRLLSPNYSSPSTRQVKDSKQGQRENNRGEDRYLSLKMNDLGCKLRNNMSSYYGMGGKEEKRDKNMAVSYNFHNKNDDNSSESSQNALGNNWTRKISGLFSDDASIKHLKGSVKFKTDEQEHFEKEYLKDVKLQMLQKFGRPVRHSIVDEQDDFDETQQAKNPYKSMQLIEEVLEDGKSHFQKEEEEEQIIAPIRKRNQTVQVAPNKKEVPDPINQNKKECISEYCESEQIESDGGFNFQPEAYVINPKR